MFHLKLADSFIDIAGWESSEDDQDLNIIGGMTA